MRRLCLLLSACLAASPVGCQLVVNTAHNAINEPVLGFDLYRLKRKAHDYAAEAWDHRYADQGCSRDFRAGYVDGFADFLESGGGGDPVAVGPRRYQRVHRLTPTDLRAVDDYFAGFQQGTADAIASNQRREFLVPVLVREPVLPAPVQPVPVAEMLPPSADNR